MSTICLKDSAVGKKKQKQIHSNWILSFKIYIDKNVYDFLKDFKTR